MEKRKEKEEREREREREEMHREMIYMGLTNFFPSKSINYSNTFEISFIFS